MSETTAPRAAFPFIKIDAGGHASLTAVRCTACGAWYAEAHRLACAKCGQREFATATPSHTGKLHAASIVERGFPGTPTPFISAVVDLDDGPVLKGMLRGVPCAPAEITAGRRVKVVFDDALGRKDAEGASYISHFFEPA